MSTRTFCDLCDHPVEAFVKSTQSVMVPRRVLESAAGIVVDARFNHYLAGNEADLCAACTARALRLAATEIERDLAEGSQ